MPQDHIHAALAAVIAKMPKWLRSDLNSPDAALRERAEESLVAIIVSAIKADETPG